MPYVVHNHGVPIGVTDLGFVRTGGADRVGWFYPNDAGEQVMPIVSAMHVAIRHVRDDQAGFEAALDRIGALRLTLHLEDGTHVPTEFIALQDTQELEITGAIADLEHDPRDLEPDPELEAQVAEMIEVWEEQAREQNAPWRPMEEPSTMGRYQVLLSLVDEHAIP